MSQAAPSLPDDVRRRIDDHLDAIERVLLAGEVSRTERRTIVDEVETQIYDMLAARPEQEPAAAVTAILAALDPPAAYASAPGATEQGGTGPCGRPDGSPGPCGQTEGSPGPCGRPEGTTAPSVASEPAAAASDMFKPFREGLMISNLRRQWRRWWSPSSSHRRVSPPAVVGAVWAGLALFLALMSAAAHRPPDPLIGLLLLVGLSGIVGVTVLGFVAVRRIRRSEGREYGLPLALVEAFLFPTILTNLALLGLLSATDGAGLVVLAGMIIIAANIALGRYAWRRFGPRFLDRVASY